MQNGIMKTLRVANGVVLHKGDKVVLHTHPNPEKFLAHPVGLPNLMIPVWADEVCIVGTQGLHEDFEDEGKNPV